MIDLVVMGRAEKCVTADNAIKVMEMNQAGE